MANLVKIEHALVSNFRNFIASLQSTNTVATGANNNFPLDMQERILQKMVDEASYALGVVKAKRLDTKPNS